MLAWRLGVAWHLPGRPFVVQAELPGSLALDAVLRILIPGTGESMAFWGRFVPTCGSAKPGPRGVFPGLCVQRCFSRDI